MIEKVFIMAVLFGGTILLMIVLWHRFYTTGKNRTLSESLIARWTELAARHSLTPTATRSWLGHQSWLLSREGDDALLYPLEVECLDGYFADYCRIFLRFKTPLEQGIYLLSEDRFGVMTTLLRSREVRIGQKNVDHHFVLLAKEDARLKALLDAQGVKQRLLDLAMMSDELIVTDDEIFMVLASLPQPEQLESLLTQLESLARQLEARAQALGPIEQHGVMDYSEVMTELTTREIKEEDAPSEGDEEEKEVPQEPLIDPSSADTPTTSSSSSSSRSSR